MNNNDMNSERRPLQLISFDGNKKLSVNPEAVAWLQRANQDKHVGVVTVVGKYRTGKSYIMNRVLLNQNHGFEVGPTINACTKGLWVWPELLPCPHDPTLQYMVMDTEGLGSLEEGEQADTKIFLMALLLSSYFIYNSVGSIDEKAVQSLSLIINLSKLLQKGTQQHMQDIIQCFPTLLWLVRDFALRLEDQQGNPISPKHYLENALRLQKGVSDLVVRKNIIRKQMNTFFKERDCFMLIRPVDDEKKLQNMASLKDHQLRPQFLEMINKLQSKIFKQVRKKHFKNKPCSPTMFIDLCQHFCSAINDGGLPQIQSNWDLVCRSQSARVQKRCCQQFQSFLQGYLKQEAKTMNMKKYEVEAKEKVSAILKYFQQHALGETASKAQHKRVLKNKMQEGYDKVLKKATEGQNDQIEDAVNEISNTLEIHMSQIKSIFEVSQLYDELIEQRGKAVSGSSLTYLFKRCYEGFRSSAHMYFGGVLQNQVHQRNVLQQKLGFCQNALNSIQLDQEKRLEDADKRERELKQSYMLLESKSKKVFQQLQNAKKQLAGYKENVMKND